MIKYLAGWGLAFLLANQRFPFVDNVDRIFIWLALAIIITLMIRLYELDRHYQRALKNETKRKKAALKKIDSLRRSYDPYGTLLEE